MDGGTQNNSTTLQGETYRIDIWAENNIEPKLDDMYLFKDATKTVVMTFTYKFPSCGTYRDSTDYSKVRLELISDHLMLLYGGSEKLFISPKFSQTSKLIQAALAVWKQPQSCDLPFCPRVSNLLTISSALLCSHSN